MVPLAEAEPLARLVPGVKWVVVRPAKHPELLYRVDAIQAVRRFLES